MSPTDYERGHPNDSFEDLKRRSIIPRERHPLDLQYIPEATHAFILVNDYDPKPLYYQFEAKHRGTFGYLEKGPDVWRVVISRSA
jgi:uncharacterized protein (DUF2249 family)